MNPAIRAFRTAAACALLLLAAGCVTTGQIEASVNAVNADFGREYERILAERGTRVVPVAHHHAFVALLTALNKLGMNIVNQDLDAGTLAMSAPAPKPLDADEWRQAAEADLPRMRKLVCPIVGAIACQSITFEPYGLMIEINATVLAVGPERSEISLTTRMREVAPDPRGRPRREYPPPTGVRLALDKIWRQFDAEFSDPARRSIPRPR